MYHNLARTAASDRTGRRPTAIPAALQRLAADHMKPRHQMSAVTASCRRDSLSLPGRQGGGAGVSWRGRHAVQGGKMRWAVRSTHSTAPVGAGTATKCRGTRGQGLRFRRRAEFRARARSGSTARCRSSSAAPPDTLAQIEPLYRHLRERGHALRRGGHRAGGQISEQHDRVPDGRGAGRGLRSRANTESTARSCGTLTEARRIRCATESRHEGDAAGCVLRARSRPIYR